MNQEQVEALRELRDQGYAVAIFTPSELGGASPKHVEDLMVSRGWDAIGDSGDEK